MVNIGKRKKNPLTKFNVREWIAARFRNAGRATCGGTAHSVVIKVYDNGRVVLDREIDFYEINLGHADDFYITGRLNAFTSELYGQMRKTAKQIYRATRRAK